MSRPEPSVPNSEQVRNPESYAEELLRVTRHFDRLIEQLLTEIRREKNERLREFLMQRLVQEGKNKDLAIQELGNRGNASAEALNSCMTKQVNTGESVAEVKNTTNAQRSEQESIPDEHQLYLEYLRKFMDSDIPKRIYVASSDPKQRAKQYGANLEQKKQSLSAIKLELARIQTLKPPLDDDALNKCPELKNRIEYLQYVIRYFNESNQNTSLQTQQISQKLIELSRTLTQSNKNQNDRNNTNPPPPAEQTGTVPTAGNEGSEVRETSNTEEQFKNQIYVSISELTALHEAFQRSNQGDSEKNNLISKANEVYEQFQKSIIQGTKSSLIIFVFKLAYVLKYKYSLNQRYDLNARSHLKDLVDYYNKLTDDEKSKLPNGIEKIWQTRRKN